MRDIVIQVTYSKTSIYEENKSSWNFDQKLSQMWLVYVR